MWRAAQRLRETLFFFRSQFPALVRLQWPVVLPMSFLLEYRFCSVLERGDMLHAQTDAVVTFLGLIMGLFASASTILLAVAVLEGRASSPAELRRQALLAMPHLLLAQLLLTFAVLGGLVMLILPGLWLAGCLAPLMVLVVAERMPVFQAMQVCVHRYRPYALHFLGAMLLLSLPLLVVIVLLGMAQSLSAHLGFWSRVLVWTLVEVAGVMVSQLFPIMLVRFRDIQQAEQA